MANHIKKVKTYHVALLGCGKMGGAMLRSWLKNDLIHKVDIICPSPPADEFLNDPRTKHITDPKNIKADILFIAVKPQVISSATRNIIGNIGKNTVIISIAAGKTLSTLQNILGDNKPIIRTMPNTPAAIGKGVSVSIANGHVNKQQKNIAEILLTASGKAIWTDDETQIDTVTALSGSGPAYVFYLIEAMAKAGENAGLDSQMAMVLARQTVIGSAALAEDECNIDIQELRKNVTSPNGTTQAALTTLMDGRFQNILNETISAAQNRAKELNK